MNFKSCSFVPSHRSNMSLPAFTPKFSRFALCQVRLSQCLLVTFTLVTAGSQKPDFLRRMKSSRMIQGCWLRPCSASSQFVSTEKPGLLKLSFFLCLCFSRSLSVPLSLLLSLCCLSFLVNVYYTSMCGCGCAYTRVYLCTFTRRPCFL